MRRPDNLVDQIVRAVSRDILVGALPPSAKLPPLRRLAESHHVTVPTAQRAVARLEELGLVEIRHGSGMKVLDPKRSANLAALPYWLEALRRDPREAARVLSDFLDLRAVLAIELLARVGPKLETKKGKSVFDAVDALERCVLDHASLAEVVAADLEITRRLLDLNPQIAFSALWSSLAALLEVVPEVAKAMYHAPEMNVIGWRAALDLAAKGQPLRDICLPLIRDLDRQTVARFKEELRR